jgi:hypothetical protein
MQDLSPNPQVIQALPQLMSWNGTVSFGKVNEATIRFLVRRFVTRDVVLQHKCMVGCGLMRPEAGLRWLSHPFALGPCQQALMHDHGIHFGK